MTYLTRKQFRDSVFDRDGHKCVLCDLPAVDAHHIIERRLWGESAGYYLDNGASVCADHHMQCETTEVSVEDVRYACGIKRIIVPEHLYADQPYDKWGNPILSNGNRLKGELFFDESVQKVLRRGRVIDLFQEWVKYPRTHHLPWSDGVNSDDRVIDSLDAFKGKRVIVTEKLDGENSSLYKHYTHARSVDGRSHPTRDWLKQFWSTIAHDIPAGWRICGENLYAKHSISYNDLSTFFMGFSIWDERNVCLSWDETEEWFNLIGITSVPVLFDGIFDEDIMKNMWDKSNWNTHEGYVIRVADEIQYGQFKTHVAKFVRENHIQTVKHWMHGQAIEKNNLTKI